MAYEKHTWTAPELITKEKLNNIEDGVEEALEKANDADALKNTIVEQISRYNAFNFALLGDFTGGTNNGVTFAWNAEHTVCTLNGNSGRSSEGRNRYLYSESGLFGMKPGETYLFKVSRSKSDIGVDLYWYINGTLGTQTRITSPTYITVPENATGVLSRVYALPASGALNNDFVGIEIMSAATNKALEEMIGDKQDAPTLAGTAGQVIGLNASLEPEWMDLPEQSGDIDDTAGAGDTDKTWSANKLSAAAADIDNLAQNNSYNLAAKYGDFADKTSRGVTFTWDSTHTVCTLNCTASPSADAMGRYLYSETGLCGMEIGKKYLFNVRRTHANTGVDLYWYINGTLGAQTKLIQPTWITVPANATGVLSRVYALAGVSPLTNAKVSISISEAPSNAYLNDRIEAAVGNPFLTPTGDTTDRADEIEAMLTSNGICNLAPGDYYVSNIEMPDESVLKGSGIGKTKIYMIAGATGSCVKLGSKCGVSEMSLYGQDTDNHGSNNERHGIGWVGTFVSESDPGTYPLHSYVSGLYIEGFAGGGIYCTNTSMRLLSGLQASNVMIIGCWAGVYIKKYSEFSQFTNIKANTCTYGCINNGGNNVFANCNFSGNVTALLMDDTNSQSPNNSHGSYVGCVFDHSGSNEGYAMTLIGLDSGEMFVGCQIFYGKTSISECLGIRFVGCNYGRKTGITVADSYAVCWDSCQFREATDTPLTQSGSTGVKFRTCMLYDGTDFDPTAT